MHIQRIHFDKVFDVQQQLGMFSFASAGAVTYSVHLPCKVIPQEGETWAVAFGQPGDWSTLLGWRDLGAQRTTLNHRLRHVIVDLAWGGYWVAVPIVALSIYVGGPWAAGAVALAALCGGAWLMRHVVRRNRLVRAALRKT
ncbi:hypothetical protein [Massilia sp. S19_KUP03_FR1]|uniref:hypothetical protein n=1 Tax=Massilia sp. S19_KUP03_FR1 TaxID=3025503 RepID=UPI002FCD9EA1